MNGEISVCHQNPQAVAPTKTVAILRPAIIGDLKKTPFFLRIVPHLSLVRGSTPELTGFAFRNWNRLGYQRVQRAGGGK